MLTYAPAVPNRLLAHLPTAQRRQLLDEAEQVELAAGTILSPSGARIRHVYFPIGCLITLNLTLDDTAQLAVGMVGREGACGLPLILGVDHPPYFAVVQGSGSAIRLHATRLRRTLEAYPTLRRSLDRYLHFILAQLALLVACTRFHSLQARLARWLAQTADGTGGDRFRITHQVLADQLAVRRVGVTTAAGALHRGGLISYRRGQVTILDRARLEEAACTCYRGSCALYDRSFGAPVSSGSPKGST